MTADVIVADPFARLCATYRATSWGLYQLARLRRREAAVGRWADRPGANPILARLVRERLAARRAILEADLRDLRRDARELLAKVTARSLRPLPVDRMKPKDGYRTFERLPR